MSKVLYPKKVKKTKSEVDILESRPYHVLYNDPSGELDPEWRYYNSELGVKLGSWYHCRLLGFHQAATMYERDEVLANDE